MSCAGTRGQTGAYCSRSLTRELPHNVPFPAKAQLIREFTKTWGDLAADLITRIRPIIERYLEADLREVFAPYQEGMLPATVK